MECWGELALRDALGGEEGEKEEGRWQQREGDTPHPPGYTHTPAHHLAASRPPGAPPSPGSGFAGGFPILDAWCREVLDFAAPFLRHGDASGAVVAWWLG